MKTEKNFDNELQAKRIAHKNVFITTRIIAPPLNNGLMMQWWA